MRFATDVREAIRAQEGSDAAINANLPKLMSYVALKPGVQAVGLYRLSRCLVSWRLRPLAYVVALLNNYLTGADLPPNATVGAGFVILHPSGVVLAGGVCAGRCFRVHSGALLGFQSGGGRGAGVPAAGDDVLVGAGAKVLGPVTLGDRVRVGANAVVLIDVPADSAVAGVPAKVL